MRAGDLAAMGPPVLRCAALACLALSAGCSYVPDSMNPSGWFEGSNRPAEAAQPSGTGRSDAAPTRAAPSGLVADRENARYTGQVPVNEEFRTPPPSAAAVPPAPQVAIAAAAPPPREAPAAAEPPPMPPAASETAAQTAAVPAPAPDEDPDHRTVPGFPSRPEPPPQPPAESAAPESAAPSSDAVRVAQLPPRETEGDTYRVARPPLRTEAYIGGTAEASIPTDMRRPERSPYGPGSQAPMGAEDQGATGGRSSIDVTGDGIRRPPLRTESYIGGTAEGAMPNGQKATDEDAPPPPIQAARPQQRLIPDVPPAVEPPAPRETDAPEPVRTQQAPVERVSPGEERRSRVPDVLPATGISSPAAPMPPPAFAQVAARSEPSPMSSPPDEFAPPPPPPTIDSASVDGAPQPLDGVTFGAPPGDIDPTATAEFQVGGAPAEPLQVAAVTPVEPAPAAAVEPDGDALALGELILQPVDDPSRIASVLFANGSAELDREARGIVEQIARLHVAEGGRLRIVGHASSRTRDMPMIRHRMVNLTLSMQRAQAVANMLNGLGVPTGAISLEAVSDTDPVMREVMPAAEGPNRRTEIFLER